MRQLGLLRQMRQEDAAHLRVSSTLGQEEEGDGLVATGRSHEQRRLAQPILQVQGTCLALLCMMILTDPGVEGASEGQLPPGVFWLSCWPHKQHAPQACIQALNPKPLGLMSGLLCAGRCPEASAWATPSSTTRSCPGMFAALLLPGAHGPLPSSIHAAWAARSRCSSK